jgi:cystathionine gamma-synthase
MVINPQSRHYGVLKANAPVKDWYWSEDAVYMERNSRDFAPRVKVMDDSAEALCEMLRARSAAFLSQHSANFDPRSHDGRPIVVKDVYYPKYVAKDNYDARRLPDGGYGGLFSVTMTSPLASRVFFNSLPCAKGPSLGTNFTLACPYTVLAHYLELDWAASFGVEEGLIRVSVGLEDREGLLKGFEGALKKAEEAVLAQAGIDT